MSTFYDLENLSSGQCSVDKVMSKLLSIACWETCRLVWYMPSQPSFFIVSFNNETEHYRRTLPYFCASYSQNPSRGSVLLASQVYVSS